jgi:MFS family permease
MSVKKIYYGWWVVSCLLLSAIMAYGIGISAFTLFITPLFEEFGWNRATMGGIVSVFWIAAPLVPLLAFLVERYGSRSVLLTGLLLEVICLISIAFISSLWELYLLRALMGLGKVMVAVTLPITVSYWFEKKFGLVVAIVLSGAHIGGVIWPPITQYLIETSGWRDTAIILGSIMLFTTIPMALVFLRVSKPEKMGLQKDGILIKDNPSTENKQDSSHASAVLDADSGFSLRQASRNINFWRVVAATFIFYMAYTGILIHEVTYISEIGFSGQFAANLLSLTEFMALIAIIGFGLLLDRKHPKFTLVSVLSLLLVGVTILISTTYLTHAALACLFALLFGAAMGGGDVMWVVALRYYFGQKHFERIYGVWYFISLSTMFVSPIIIGFFYDQSQSYVTAFFVILASVCAGLLLVLTLPAKISHSN